ncbi:MAG: hypothetical protein BGO78_11630 [Chloroflexi bacterium 44-23]|nr:MAG: hypothetical protein BGO78_11630 [Chloroflexi bacterium 44-23]
MEHTITLILLFLILMTPLSLVLMNKLRMDVAAMIMAVSLGILQLLGLGLLGPVNTPGDAVKAISGFSQPVVLTLLALFIMAKVLENSGLTHWLAFQIVRLGGSNERVYIAAFSTASALLSLFMNNLTAAAMILPAAMEVARQTRVKPSKLLIPVAFGSLLGGSATYFTSANIIVSDLLTIAHPPQATLSVLSFTPTGGLIAIAGIIFLTVFGKKLLPDHAPSAEQAFARLTGNELEDFYKLGERLWEAKIGVGSQCAFKSLNDCGFGKDWGVVVAAVRHNGEDFALPLTNQVLWSGDTILLVGREERIDPLREMGLMIHAVNEEDHLSMRGITVAELVLGPHSEVLGKTLREIDFRQKFGLTVVALRRMNRSHRTSIGDMPLAFGDSLLVIGSGRQLQGLKKNSNFIILESNPADLPVRGRLAILSSGIILASIAAAIAGVPVFLAALSGAVLMLVLDLITMEEAYQAIEWQPLFLIAGMYTISLAMDQTGAAELISHGLLQMVEPLGGLGLAAGAFVFSALLTQFMGGHATALVSGPITISAAIALGVSPQAVAVATAIGCSASFLTPMSHPVNILVIGPGNYQMRDFLRVGWVLTIISFTMMLVGMALFWGLRFTS